MNANNDEKVLAEAMRRSNRANYVRTHIKQPLEEMVAVLLKKRAGVRDEAVDSLLPLLLTYVDLLGYLYTGKSKNTPIAAVDFLRGYLGRMNKDYREIGGLLYCALRHGMVHLATPKRIKLTDGRILDFTFILGMKQKDHLTIKKRLEFESRGQVEIYRLSFNLPQFYRDLLSAIDSYAEDVAKDQKISDVFWAAFVARRDENEGRLLKKPYVWASDFDFIRKQMVTA